MTDDFFRSRLDAMMDLRHPLAVLATRLPCDPTNLVRFRQALGESGVEELLATTITVAAGMKAVSPVEFDSVIVDTTVQEKAIAFPTDSRLLEVARAKLVKVAQRAGLMLKQTYEREGRQLRRRAGSYAHAKQYRRLCQVVGGKSIESIVCRSPVDHQV